MEISGLAPKETFLTYLDVDPIVEEAFMPVYERTCCTDDGKRLIRRIVARLETSPLEERLRVIWGRPGFRPRSNRLKFMTSDYFAGVSGAPGEDPRKIDVCLLYHELVHVYQWLLDEPMIPREDDFKNSLEVHAVRGKLAHYGGENAVRRGLGLRHRLTYAFYTKEKDDLLSKSVAADHLIIRNKYFIHILLAADFTKDEIVKFYRENKIDLPFEKVKKLLNTSPPIHNIIEAFTELGLIN